MEIVLTYHRKHMRLHLVRRYFRVFLKQLAGIRGDPREGLVVPCHALVLGTDLRRGRVELPPIGQAHLFVLTHLLDMIIQPVQLDTHVVWACVVVSVVFGGGAANTVVGHAWHR